MGRVRQHSARWVPQTARGQHHREGDQEEDVHRVRHRLLKGQRPNGLGPVQ